MTDHRGADEPARGLTHRRERFGQDLVEHVGDRLAQLAFDAAAAIRAAQLVVDPLALGGIARRCASRLLERGDLRPRARCVRSRMIARNFAVCPRSSSSETPCSRA